MELNFKIDKERDLIVAFTNPLEVNDEEVEEQLEKVVEKFVEDFGHEKNTFTSKTLKRIPKENL